MKDKLIKALAKYLVEDQVRKGMELGSGKASAKEWAELRAAANIMGYPTVEETEKHLKKLLK
jgi:hypothetical protein